MITRHLAIGCLIYLALALQTGIARDCMIFESDSWLPGIVVVACVLTTDGAACLIWAALLGLGLDCQSLDHLGVHVVVATFVASLLIWIRSDARSQGIMAIAMYVFGATFLWKLATEMIHGVVDHRSWDLMQSLTLAGFSAACTSGLTGALLIGVSLVKSAGRLRKSSSVSLNNQWSMLTGK